MKSPTALLVLASLFFIFLLGARPAHAQSGSNSVRTVWSQDLREYLWWQHFDSAENLYLLFDGNDDEPWLLDFHKLDRSGGLKWKKREINRLDNNGMRLGIATDSLRNVYISEEQYYAYGDPKNPGTRLSAINCSGEEVWSQLYDAPAFVVDHYIGSAAIGVDRQNRIYQISWAHGNDSERIEKLLCYDDHGTRLSIRDVAECDCPLWIIPRTDSGIYLYGCYAFKYNATGPAVASSEFLGLVTSVVTDKHGNSYCISEPRDYEYWITKLDANLSIVWRKEMARPFGQPLIIRVDSDGNSTIFGHYAPSPVYYQWVKRYDPSGMLLWVQQWTLEDWTGPLDFDLDALGNLYSIDDSGGVRSYDPIGNLRWSVRLRDHLGVLYAWDLRLPEIHVGSTGDIYVTVNTKFDVDPTDDIDPLYRTYLRRFTQPKTLDILDAKGDSIPNTEFNLIRVHNDPPFYTEDTLGAFTTDIRGQFVLPFASASNYLFETSPTNPVVDTLHPGDTIKVARAVDLVFAARHQALLGSAYTVHLDNQRFAPDGLPTFDTVQFGSTQQIMLNHTEYRYNLLASVEWDAELVYLQGLEAEFKTMSNYLYDVSDGQIRLDTVVIVDNKSNWLDADVRIVAQNTYGPDADIMGIGLIGLAPITMPRKWCGSPDSSRIFTYLLHPLDSVLSDHARTLAHELGHYGLAFDDEYLFADAFGRDVPRPGACLPYPAGNFGFMSSQYDRPTSGNYASEMSSIYRYQTGGCTNTRQMVSNSRSCWDDFEYWAERYRNGIFVPILKPSLTDSNERATPTGLDYFPGPNDDLFNLDYDVGDLVHFPIAQAPPSANIRSIRVTVAGAPAGGVGVSVLKNGSNLNTVDQGVTDDAGRIWALGVDQFADVITASGHAFAASPVASMSDEAGAPAVQRGWTYASAELNGEESVTLTLDTVNGYYPMVCQATLTDNGWEYGMNFETAFTHYPEYSISTQSGATGSGVFSAGSDNYGAPVASFLTESGHATISAMDATGETFFFETPFAIKEISTPLDLRKVIASSGDAVVRLDTGNVGISRVMMLSSPYPPIQLGLDPGALQGGQTHSLACYPDTNLSGGNVLSIAYANSDLRNPGGAAEGLEAMLRIYRWTGAEQGWALVGGNVDTVSNLVSATITQTGTYGAFTLYSNSSCCTGTRGNVNMQGMVDLTDLSLLIGYLTITPKPTLPCPLEANVNGVGLIDLTDLSLLIGYLTITPKPILPNCP